MPIQCSFFALHKPLRYLLCSIILGAMACQEPTPPPAPPPTPIEKPAPTPSAKKKTPPKRKRSVKAQGRAELYAFEEKYKDTWKEKPAIFPYSKAAFYKVYPLNCSGGCSKAIFYDRTAAGIDIPKEDFMALLKILKAPSSYGEGTGACFDPKFGLVAYDQDSIPTEFLSICLDCNNIKTYPGSLGVKYENQDLKGFSTKARKKLRTLFFKWGINYYGYDEFLDDQEEFFEYLEQQNSK